MRRALESIARESLIALAGEFVRFAPRYATSIWVTNVDLIAINLIDFIADYSSFTFPVEVLISFRAPTFSQDAGRSYTGVAISFVTRKTFTIITVEDLIVRARSVRTAISGHLAGFCNQHNVSLIV